MKLSHKNQKLPGSKLLAPPDVNSQLSSGGSSSPGVMCVLGRCRVGRQSDDPDPV